ncbi:glycosyltransferase family 2 protein, partial [Burkholderia multivorans]
ALLMFCIISIWGAVFQSILIMVGAVRFIFRQSRKEWTIPDADQMAHFPKVTVLVPAHNEELVIAATAEHILRLNYPKDKVQLIVIADNCSDGTAGRLKALNSKAAYRDRDFMVFERSGTGGKSGALNDALA